MLRITVFIFFMIHVVPATLAYFLFPSINFFSGYFFILILFCSFVLGIFISKYVQSNLKKELYRLNIISKRKHMAIILLIVIIFLSRNDQIIQMLTALFQGNLIELALENAIERYLTPYAVNYSTFYRVGTAMLFCLSYVLGALYKNSYNDNLYLIILVFFIFFELAWTLGRQGAFFSIICFVIGYIVNNRSSISQISFYNLFKYSGIFVSTLIIIWGTVQFGRVTESATNPLAIVIERFSRYTIIPFAVFMSWCNEWDQSLHYGAKTFASIYELFGLDVIQGFYSRYYIDNTSYSNIFTIYRGLLQDFGIALSSIIFIFFGYKVCLYEIQKTRLLDDMLIKIILMLIFFPLTSMMYSTSILVGLVCSSLVINYCTHDMVNS